MVNITLDKGATQSYRLKASAVGADGLIEIATGPNTVGTILAPLNWVVDGQTTATLQQGKSIVLKINKPTNAFHIISGYFLATTPLNTNTIPAGNVTGLPGPLQSINFQTIANQLDYPFDGTVTAWNPTGLDLTNDVVPMYFSDGVIKIPTTNYTWNPTTATLSLVGKIYAGVQAILFYYSISLG